MAVQTLVLEDFPQPVTARALSPNGRAHWAVQKAEKEKTQVRVYVAAKRQGLRRIVGMAVLRPHFTFPEHRRRDDDNLATGVMKAVRDGLVRGGYLKDDDTEHVRQMPVQVSVERGRRALVLEIEDEADVAAD